MDVLRLDSSTYLPDELIEGYSSFIWTERYLEAGEFELTTPLVSKTRALLPEGTLITLRDTREVMVVETHSIEVGDDRSATLKVTGRTLESFAENRAIRGLELIADNKDEWQTIRDMSTVDICSVLLKNYMDGSARQELAHPNIPLDPRDVVPRLVITRSVTKADTPKRWWVQPGNLYDTVIDFLALAELGIRTIRPTRANEPIAIDIFNGKESDVVFRYDAGHIEDPSYLFSIKSLKNVAYVRGSSMSFDVWPRTGRIPPKPEPTGFDRRVLFVDGGDQEDLTPQQFETLLIQKAQIELMKHNRATIFDGTISPLATHEYGKHYGLGDRVTLSAEYGFQETMLVAEHVRTEDQAGDQAYPTLILAENNGEG